MKSRSRVREVKRRNPQGLARVPSGTLPDFALRTGKTLGLLFFPKLLRRDAQGPIKFTRRVFPCDGRGQLDQSILVIEVAQLGEQFLTDVLAGDGHCIRKLQSEPFRLGKEFAVCVVQNGFDLLLGNSQAATHGSVDVLSKLTAIQECNATVKQRSQGGVY